MPKGNRSENEETETETNKTNKVSDSGYSNSCSNNSQSQRSNSSKSRHSISSGSSGYCGHPSTLNNSVNEENNTKKKSKLQVTSSTTSGRANDDDTSFTPPNPADAVIVKKPTPRCVDPAVLDNMSAPTAESEALQVAVLAQTLFCIQTNTSVQPLDDHDMLSPPAPANNEPHSAEMVLSVLKDELKHDKEFCVVVSLSDGSVVYSTPSLTNVLGFPKDMWIGRSLINFMHPKDRIAFASHITSAMAQSHFKQKETMIVEESDKIEDTEYFYCWIRLYNGLKTSGFNVSDKNPAYLPCQLSMSFKEVPDQGVLLVATARIVKSAYKVTDEIRTNPPTFTTRHTANTLISHVDDDVVTHFGYLPHDMIGRSIFDFYYSEDLPYLKDVYRQVVTEEGPLFLSRPYKFRCQNGDYVMVETEWSSFINPWGKKLEFIIGRHKVLTGPQNADVVRPVLEPEVISNNEEDLIGSKVFQEEIKVLLTEPIVRCYEPSQQQLAQLVESLEKISNSQLQDQSTDVRVPSATSEMLGEISPHHVYSDSKSSSETPPSYTQLTYNENIHRFFASEPKTAGVDGSRDPKIEPNLSSSSGGEEEKSMLNNSSFNSNSNSCLNREGSGQSSDPSSNSPAHNRSKHEISGDEKKKPFNDHYNTKPLTEEMLYQHNENMNKQMAQKHKKDKTKSQVNRKHKRMQLKNHKVNDQEDQGAHGMKRSVSNSWQGEPMKVFKGVHQEQPASNVRNHLLQEASNIPRPLHTLYSAQPIAGHMNYASPLVNPIMQLPCVYMNPLPPAPAVCLHENRVPVNRNLADEHRPDGPGLDIHRPPLHVPAAPYVTHQVQYMPSLMYQLPLLPMVYTQSHIVPPTVKPRMTYMPNINLTTLPQQQTWRATSVKEEPGSALCSFASASLKQALSVSSKKENKSRTSSPVYSPDLTSNTGKTKTGTFDNDLTHDDTSFCSYSSLFPKTEKSDDSMKDSEDKENNGQFKTWRNNSSPENNAHKKIRKEPTWMENVEVSEELMLRYQLEGCILSKVLQSDFETLLKFNQPEMVNEQLDQLYVDLEGLSKQLTLEESFPSSGSSGDERNLAIAGMPSTSSSTPPKTKKKRKFMGHDKCAMIFEEDAPMPPSSAELIAIAAESS